MGIILIIALVISVYVFYIYGDKFTVDNNHSRFALSLHSENLDHILSDYPSYFAGLSLYDEVIIILVDSPTNTFEGLHYSTTINGQSYTYSGINILKDIEDQAIIYLHLDPDVLSNLGWREDNISFEINSNLLMALLILGQPSRGFQQEADLRILVDDIQVRQLNPLDVNIL